MNIGMNGDDRHGRLEPDEVRAPAPLEHHDHHAVGGADAQQVQQRRLQRHEDRPEHHGQQHERQQDDGGDEQRQPIVDLARRCRAKVAVWPPTWASAGLPASTDGKTSARSRSIVSSVASSCGAGRREREQRRDAGVALISAEVRPRRCPGRPRRRRAAARRRSGRSEMSTAMTSGPLMPGPKPVGDEVVGPALGPAARAACPRRGSRGAGRAPARRAPAAATVAPMA